MVAMETMVVDLERKSFSHFVFFQKKSHCKLIMIAGIY